MAYRKWTLCACVLAALAGCRAPKGMLLSLEDVSAEVKVGRKRGRDHLRMASFAGALPGFDAGVPYHYKPRNKRSLPPQTAFGLTKGESYVLEMVYRRHAQTGEVQQIRTALLDVRVKALDAVTAKLALARARLDGDQQRIAASERDFTVKRGAYSVARARATGAIRSPNLLVFQYSSSNERGGSLSVGSLGSAGYRHSQDQSGFAIANGIRIARLFVGTDVGKSFLADLEDLESSAHMRVTTFVMQAEEIHYVSEAELGFAFQAKLAATVEQLGNLRGALTATDKIEIELLIAGAVSAASGGSLTGAESRAVPVYWNRAKNAQKPKGPRMHQLYDLVDQVEKIAPDRPRSQRYVTFYQADTELSKIVEFGE